jgi:hypothetical protein
MTVQISQVEGNALGRQDDGLYVPTSAVGGLSDVDIDSDYSMKIGKVTINNKASFNITSQIDPATDNVLQLTTSG